MRRLVVMAALLCGLGGFVLAQDGSEQEVVGSLTVEDTIAIRQAVKAQLEAFAKDDAATAFELATPEKRMLIGSPDDFMQLIRESYEPIYRNKVLIFSETKVVEGMALQTVRVTDSYSRVWVAVFWMQQDEELNWKIDGCHLVETAIVSV